MFKGYSQVAVYSGSQRLYTIDPWDAGVECDYWNDLGYNVTIDEERRIIKVNEK